MGIGRPVPSEVIGGLDCQVVKPGAAGSLRLKSSHPFFNRPFPNSPHPRSLFSFQTVPAQQPPNPRGMARCESFQLRTVCSFFFFFSLDHFFWQGQRATVACGFKCAFFDCCRETLDWRANSKGTKKGREPEPESSHPPHSERFSPWGTSRDYLLVRQRVPERHTHASSA